MSIYVNAECDCCGRDIETSDDVYCSRCHTTIEEHCSQCGDAIDQEGTFLQMKGKTYCPTCLETRVGTVQMAAPDLEVAFQALVKYQMRRLYDAVDVNAYWATTLHRKVREAKSQGVNLTPETLHLWSEEIQKEVRGRTLTL